MAQQLEDSLLQAIKKDDIKSFNALMEKAHCGAYRLGRFPVLSLLYLYNSRAILAAYEEKFLKITGYEQLQEPVEISKKFSPQAGKCLRLYLSETVSPLEMLLILDNTKRLKRVYPLTKPSSSIKERLKTVYSIKYSLSVKFEGDEIVLDRRPLNYREKKRIATVCMSCVLAVTLTVGATVTAVVLSPKQGEVTNFSQIDFTSQEDYTLKKDIVVPADFSVDKMNCNISGGGHKLILGKGATLGELNGKLSGTTIESSGGAIFTTVTEKATIENVTVNITSDVIAEASTALVVLTNYGTLDGVTVNVSGSIETCSEASSEGFYVGGVVLNNSYKNISNKIYYGTVKNCTVNYSQLSLTGVASADAAFGGVTGVNGGFVLDCTVTGEIVADTFDIAGVCAVNNYLLSGVVNEAKLSQVSYGTEWNPIACGIVITNNSFVEYCTNKGAISAVSDCGDEVEEDKELVAVAAGIASVSYGNINFCANEGAVLVTGTGTAYAGGIAYRAYGQIYNCVSSGDITVTAQSAYAGGILGVSDIDSVYDYINNQTILYLGIINSCISDSKLVVTGSTAAYVGGVVGLVRERGFNDGIYYGGGVLSSYFTGECATDVTYFGNIVGVCASNIYETNSYRFGSDEYMNFDGNVYIANSLEAFGAVVYDNVDFVSGGDKGATTKAEDEIKNSEEYKSILSALVK